MRQTFILFPILILLFSSCEGDDAMDPILIEEEFSIDLFFSEYVEGTSFNKALEIANFTGETIDLEASGYSIRKQSNGEGNWMGELILTGSILNEEVFVIGNESSTEPDLLNSAQQLKSGAPMDFNGNDAIGLFKDDVLIDVIGVLDEVEDYGKDVTLRRVTEITEPSAIFNSGEWEAFEVDDFSGLGSHSLQ
ncbi:hypothetical protein LZ575_05050 [Antarcticibacterium sp. 1MA-6-2]|uniref:hypothetical protein n=1 Tax=Antarcticibacterium sp. 1MA-6-2 TaxID=2908210 RepID=UPI001F16D6A4|nr:hypothetical protein [Antarcticibacterium sp. 1MA-6-2]UJH91997.1 hypothetical protein LZ575_05050 [Antarcticibacterium sp. 1MA-6-2]